MKAVETSGSAIYANTAVRKKVTSEVVFPEESYRIVGACFEVYNELGCGFLEAV